MLLLFVCVLVCGVSAQSGDPECPADLPIRDPSTGKTYHYNIGAFKVADTDQSGLIAGKEASSSWTAYFNICGNAQVVGCTSPTPACQNDGGGEYISMGDPSTWTMSAYYDPAAGPTTIIPDGGIVATISNGTPCAVSGPRSTTFFLKCDPTVTVRPTTVQVSETNPSNGQVTVCHYWVAPIAHRDFCPTQLNEPIADSAPINYMYAKLFPNVTVSFTAVTTDASLLEEAGFQCASINASCTNAYRCQGSASESGSAQVPLIELAFSYKDSTFKWSSTNGVTAVCPNDGEGFFSATGPNSAWDVDHNGITAVVGETSILSLSGAVSQKCFRCSAKKK